MFVLLKQSDLIASGKKFTVVVLFTIFINSIEVHSKTSSDSWLLFARETNSIFDKCSKSLQSNETAIDMWSCLKRNSLTLFDKITSNDVIPLTNNIQLIRGTRNTTNDINVMKDDPVLSRIYQTPMTYDTIDVNRTVWVNHVLRRSIDILGSHDIRFVFGDSMKNDVGQARRRNRNRIFPSMIFGMATLGCVIIPLGFHMLALLGGKAFFISKMALLVATITSMKKLTTIGGYLGIPGVYQGPHYPPPGSHQYPQPQGLPPNYWERS